jgi:hypothetical protein
MLTAPACAAGVVSADFDGDRKPVVVLGGAGLIDADSAVKAVRI